MFDFWLIKDVLKGKLMKKYLCNITNKCTFKSLSYGYQYEDR